MPTDLSWLPPYEAKANGRALLAALEQAPWSNAMAIANTRLDFIRTNQLDDALRRALRDGVPADLAAKPVRLAILGSCTTAQLHPAIRVAGLRRNIHITIYEADYGQYWQELSDPSSELHSFKPTMILLALDGHHLAAGVNTAMAEAEVEGALGEVMARIQSCWQLAREHFACPVIQQTPCRCILPCSAATSTDCRVRRPRFSRGLGRRCGQRRTRPGLTC